MASVSRLRVQHVRSHTDYNVLFNDDVTVITGLNGSGKTSLLESIYISLQGASFKGSDSDILSVSYPWWRIDITLDSEDRTVSFDSSRPTSRKQFTIDNKKTARLPLKNKHPVVLFEPEDLRLLHGSPVRRRQFIDRFISQLNPLYGTALRKYERTLKQRNTLLKDQRVSDDHLFAWNISLAEHGAYIIEQRIAFIERINESLAPLYRELSGTDVEVSVHYSHTFVGDVKQKILNELHAHLQRDRYLGNTSVGPHRHDVIFELNHSPALSIASRGEVRTIVLALKFLEVHIINELTGKKPIILFDDVFSELDAERQKLLTTRLTGYQIIITSATSQVDINSTINLTPNGRANI